MQPYESTPLKPKFYDLCAFSQFDYCQLQTLADQAGVAGYVVNAMFVGDPVDRVAAEKVLAALSRQTGQSRTLNTVNVALLPGENNT